MHRLTSQLKAIALAGASALTVVAPSQAAVNPMDSAEYAVGGFTSRAVSFTSGGSKVAGLLFGPTAPVSSNARRPGVVLLGPFGSIKEQSPLEYATRLARDGYVTLIFDPRYSGESGGEPRRLESPRAKIADVIAAIDFLQTQPGVDSAKLAALGVCQGSSEMLAVAATDPRIKVLATVSGQYIYPANIDGFFSGGGLTRSQRIARGEAAKAKFEKTGEVDYLPVVSLTDSSAGLPWKPIHDWYLPWTTEKWAQPSRWENRYAAMSDAELWTFNVDDFAPQVAVPTLIVHGEMSDGKAEAAQHVFDRLKAKDKRLVVFPGVFHTRFYDDPLVIDPAAAQVSRWFAQHLR